MDPIQTPVQIPDFQPKPNYLKTIIFSVLVIITLSLIGYLVFQNQKLQKQVLNPQVSPTIQVPSPTSKPSSSTSISPDETAGWKTFTGNSLRYSNSVYSGYSLKYPPICSLTDKILTCKTKHGIATLIIDAGGHGGGITEIKVLRDNETKVIPAGEGKINEIKDMTNNKVTGTFWINKTDKLKQEPIFGFEFKDIPLEDVDEFEVIFNQILSTFKFIDNKSVCVPTYQVETNSVELTAEQNYSMRCTEQRSEKDCFSIDLYNQKADDFSTPDGIPDCIWKNPINTI